MSKMLQFVKRMAYAQGILALLCAHRISTTIDVFFRDSKVIPSSKRYWSYCKIESATRVEGHGHIEQR